MASTDTEESERKDRKTTDLRRESVCAGAAQGRVSSTAATHHALNAPSMPYLAALPVLEGPPPRCVCGSATVEYALAGCRTGNEAVWEREPKASGIRGCGTEPESQRANEAQRKVLEARI